eukprot:9491317-Pyramimonas_sp.AAC.2
MIVPQANELIIRTFKIYIRQVEQDNADVATVVRIHNLVNTPVLASRTYPSAHIDGVLPREAGAGSNTRIRGLGDRDGEIGLDKLLTPGRDDAIVCAARAIVTSRENL